MKKIVDLAKLDRLDRLIRLRATGDPDSLAKRLGISVGSVKAYIRFIREGMQAPVRYNMYIQSYMYDHPPNFYLGFERDRSKQVEQEKDISS
jgi:hypothetical protein